MPRARRQILRRVSARRPVRLRLREMYPLLGEEDRHAPRCEVVQAVHAASLHLRGRHHDMMAQLESLPRARQ